MQIKASSDQSKIAVVDYGSQYAQLIVRRLRELGYFSRLYNPEEFPDDATISAIILSGGPSSVEQENNADLTYQKLLDYEVPILGICYGMQKLVHETGGSVQSESGREYGPARITVAHHDMLFDDIDGDTTVWMSHSDTTITLPEDARPMAYGENGSPVAVQWPNQVYGMQFHPEVSHTEDGKTILSNFLSLIPDQADFRMPDYRDRLIKEIRKTVDGREVVCGVSGGVDSTVLATLLEESGINTQFLFINTGLLRYRETKEVQEQFDGLGIDIDVIDASDEFLSELDGVTDPEQKRNRIGQTFLNVFFEQAGEVELLAQGTLYPDVIESASSGSDADRIKTHHNQVDSIQQLKREGRVLEPLKELYKDEVRELGQTLNIPDRILQRHPFPGPGLAIRLPGEITERKLDILRRADHILIETLKESGWYEKCWQTLCVLLPVKTVGVKGDERSYEHPLAIRSVSSKDGMTADWSRLPHELLQTISTRILNQVDGINRVLYDISTKPPASIEWE